MPAARQRSRSPGIALAVSATIGVRRPFSPLRAARMARVASKPSMHRHLAIHQHEVEARGRQRG